MSRHFSRLTGWVSYLDGVSLSLSPYLSSSSLFTAYKTENSWREGKCPQYHAFRNCRCRRPIPKEPTCDHLTVSSPFNSLPEGGCRITKELLITEGSCHRADDNCWRAESGESWRRSGRRAKKRWEETMTKVARLCDQLSPCWVRFLARIPIPSRVGLDRVRENRT